MLWKSDHMRDSTSHTAENQVQRLIVFSIQVAVVTHHKLLAKTDLSCACGRHKHDSVL